MIGQNSLKKDFKDYTLDTIPKFILLIATRGQGKRTFAEYLAKQFNVSLVILNSDIDSIRKFVEESYNNKFTIFYYIPEIESLSVQAQSVLLKYTEEQPKNSVLIAGDSKYSFKLSPLRNRAKIFAFYRYMDEEKKEYLGDHEYAKEILDYSQNLYFIDLYKKQDMKKFMKFVNYFADNFGIMKGYEAFNLLDKMYNKDGSEEYNFELVINTLFKLFCKKLELLDYADCCSKYLYKFQQSTNKKVTMDMWILAMREIYFKKEG